MNIWEAREELCKVVRECTLAREKLFLASVFLPSTDDKRRIVAAREHVEKAHTCLAQARQHLET